MTSERESDRKITVWETVNLDFKVCEFHIYFSVSRVCEKEPLVFYEEDAV